MSKRAPGVLLLVENNGYPMDFRVRREAIALRDAGYKVTVISPRGKGQSWVEDVDGVIVYRFPPSPGGRGILSYAFEFGYSTFAILLLSIWVSLRQGVQVVHAANPPDTLFVIGALFRVFGKKFIFDHHDLAPEVYLSRFTVPRKNLISRALSLLERLSYAVANVVVATNESYKARAIEKGKMSPDKVFVVRNGPPLSYQPVIPDPALVGRAPYIIGYIGTIGPQDGVDYWLRAIRHMVYEKGRTDFLAVIIGDGDAYPDVLALAKDLDIEAFILFTGRLGEGEARKYLSATTLCVQPDPKNSLNDYSTMNKLMEYMALGKPTVAFDLHETRFSAQDSALYAVPNEEADFADRVLWLLDNPEARMRMGGIGRARVASALAWEHSVPQLLRAYDECLGAQRIVEHANGR